MSPVLYPMPAVWSFLQCLLSPAIDRFRYWLSDICVAFELGVSWRMETCMVCNLDVLLTSQPYFRCQQRGSLELSNFVYQMYKSYPSVYTNGLWITFFSWRDIKELILGDVFIRYVFFFFPVLCFSGSSTTGCYHPRMVFGIESSQSLMRQNIVSAFLSLWFRSLSH